MTALQILLDNWRIALALASAWVAGAAVGQVMFAMNGPWALGVVDKLDAQRKGYIRFFYDMLQQPWGLAKATGFAFFVNLLGASLFQHSVLGSLLIPPFLFLFMGGFLVSLLLRKHPDRLLIIAVVSPFEFGAFVVAATGGVGVGMSLWGIGSPDPTVSALGEWALLFLVVVVPLQLIGAVAEAILARRLPDTAWPAWIFDERV